MKKSILAACGLFLIAAITPAFGQCTAGDLNGDGVVTLADYSAIVRALVCGDMDGDNDVDGCDAAALLALTPFAVDGDVNGDGSVDSADSTEIFNYVTGMPVSAMFCCCKADVNCDGSVDIADGIYLNNFLFNGGPPPCATPPCPTSCP